jgi:hypothetical protein
MLTETMMSILNADVEPLAVKPRTAWQMLQCSNTRGYELLNAGELESFRDGGSRKITVASIKSYIERRLAAGPSSLTRSASARQSQRGGRVTDDFEYEKPRRG